MTQTRTFDDSLRRLLGSDADDIGCEGCFAELDRYVEVQLAGADADEAVPGMRTHLDCCPPCAEEHESLLALLSSDRGQED